MIEKNYQPADIEARMSVVWEDSLAFKAGRPDRRDAVPFTIVIPPPNVTGSLHMGHALNNTLQDILCRFERMRGRDVLWQPGTDHAGIATQMVVERQLMERQQPGRREMGREKFLERVWQWKAESGDTIINQLKRLGASCDWSRERFTMDEGLSKAVVKVFVELHRDGLIYKDKRLVNWDTKLLTAISDLEVQQTEVKGHLWYLRYPIEGKIFNPEDPTTFIVVATTRPETMLGDTGVAVHPDDERYQKLVGKNVILPLVGRKIQIVADDYSDPEKGSGAVKVTPAHDFNDFEVGNRHGLRRISVLDKEGCLDLLDNEDYLKRPAGRRLAIRRGVQQGRPLCCAQAHRRAAGIVRLRRADRAAHPHGAAWRPLRQRDRAVSDRPVVRRRQDARKTRDGGGAFGRDHRSCRRTGKRPTSSGWRTSSPGASRASSGGAIRSRPGTVPTARCSSPRPRKRPSATRSAITSSRKSITVEQGREMALDRNKREGFITRDEDVLDTWFSSALWPFSTLGWPEDAPEVKRYYPTNVLVTGFDIIFFWVARMMMMGLHFMKEAPFSTVYIHAPRPRREGRQDVEVEGQRHRSAQPDRRVWRGRAALYVGARWRRRARDIKLAVQPCRRSTAISRPSSGTPAASRR